MAQRELQRVLNELSTSLEHIDQRVSDVIARAKHELNLPDYIPLNERQYTAIVGRRIAKMFDMNLDVMTDFSRASEAVKYRQTLMYILKRKTSWPLSIIGVNCSEGRRRPYDHATVLHSIREIENDLDTFDRTNIDQRGTCKVIRLAIDSIPSFNELNARHVQNY